MRFWRSVSLSGRTVRAKVIGIGGKSRGYLYEGHLLALRVPCASRKILTAATRPSGSDKAA